MNEEGLNKILLFLGLSFLCSALILSCSDDYPTDLEYRENTDSIGNYKSKLDSMLRFQENRNKMQEVNNELKINKIPVPDSNKAYIDKKNHKPDSDVTEYERIEFDMNNYLAFSLKLNTKRNGSQQLMSGKDIPIGNLILQPAQFMFDFSYFRFRIKLMQKNSK